MAEENKTKMEILNEIMDYRNNQLVDSKDNSVFNTKISVLSEGENSKKEIYRIIEKYSLGEDKSAIRELFYTYEEDMPNLIAVIDSSKFDGILPAKEIGDNEEEQKEWEATIQDILEGREKSEENTKKQALKLGINKEELEGKSEIDIDEKISKKIDEINKDNGKTVDEEEQEEDKTINISQEEAQKHGIIGMNTIPLNQKIGTHGETLKSVLGLDDIPEYKDVDSIEYVPSYKASEFGETVLDVPLIPMVRHSDNSLETFPKKICRPYKGENNEITNVDGYEDKVTKEKSDCIMEFANGKTLSAKQTGIGRCEISLNYNTRNNDGRVGLTLQDKYQGSIQTDVQAREILDSHQGNDQYDKIRDEANPHNDECLGRDEADGDENTGHVHPDLDIEMTPDTVLIYEGREMKISEIAALPRFKSSPNEFIDKYEKVIKENGEIELEDIYDEIEEEVNNDLVNNGRTH